MLRPPNLVEIERELIRRGGFAEFARRAWPLIESFALDWNWHHTVVCDALDRVAKKEIRNLIINIPPGCTKTTLVTKLFPAYLWALDPSERVIRASYDRSLMIDTAGDGGGTKQVVQSDWYRALYPHVEMHDDRKSGDGFYKTTAHGFQFCTSTDRGKLTGRHGTVKIVDDPLKPSEISGAALDRVNEWYGSTLATRDATADARTIVIAQRVARNDLPGYLLSEDAQGGWVHLSIPMRYTGADLAIGEDPRTEIGELLWPSRFSEEKVQALQRALGNNASAQLQQEPVPEGGLIFRREWFPYWNARTIPAVLDRVVLSVDCTFKASKEADRVAFLIAGQRGIKLYALHFEAKQMGFVDTCATLDRLCKRWKPSVILVEDKANGSAVLDTFKNIAPGLVAYNPGNNSKEGRANGVTGYCQAGDFLLGEGVQGQDAFLAELLDFPRGKNDDYVDVLTQLLHWALGGACVVHGVVSLGDGMAAHLGIG